MNKILAKNILKKVRNTYSTKHIFAPVNSKDFKHLSLKFYDISQKHLESLGFRYMGDVENITLKNKSPNPRTFLRIMSNPANTINLAIYQIKPNILWRFFLFIIKFKHYKVIELQTEFDSGLQLITTTVTKQWTLPKSPEIFTNEVPINTTLDDLVEKHRAAMTKISTNTGKQAKELDSLDKILEFENRQYDIQNKYLESIGWVTEEYLLTQNGGNKKQAKIIHEDIQSLLAEEKSSV